MGLFLDMLAVAGADGEGVEHALREYVGEHGGMLTPTDSIAADADTLVITDSLKDKVSVVHGGSFYCWDSVARYLSSRLAAPVFHLHIHDGDMWLYSFYVNGQLRDAFNPLPSYWSDAITAQERVEVAGDALVLSQHWPGLDPDAVRGYLVCWDDLDPEDEVWACPDDQFPAGDAWQVVDFMRALGVQYPFDDERRIAGRAFHLTLSNEP